MIQQHHKITRHSAANGERVEAFRKADWIDVSLGLLPFGLSREFRRQLKASFPNAGFHKRLVQLSTSRLKTHPLSPMPMMRW
ncbi:MAG: hypothetical protein JWQ90_3679 [Hydrocarboniphaga sp.]|uniref:hypothetical protein n=1 Tax=Hydrocarboniphaga sp. TaxID=2033016 RepID=UPI002631A18D|nr:hypothetical protein [Hydrocarboniphaga sp.]MDB5971229.1 hypothetical protein [Hydrocarboniphaga sp.]